MAKKNKFSRNLSKIRPRPLNSIERRIKHLKMRQAKSPRPWVAEDLAQLQVSVVPAPKTS